MMKLTGTDLDMMGTAAEMKAETSGSSPRSITATCTVGTVSIEETLPGDACS
jgi:hypothetical protein